MAAKFATAINCMDGRTQVPVGDWLRARTGALYVDAITEPGPVKLLADGLYLTRIDWMRAKVDVSVDRHGSRVIAVVAHSDCAGNPAPKETQLRQLAAAVKRVRGWRPECEVIGLWVDENWEVEPQP